MVGPRFGVEYNISSVSSATTTGSSFDTKLPNCMLESDLHYESDTDREVIDYQAWCGEIWADGHWPWVGYRGEPFADGSYRYRKRGHPIAGPWRGAFAAWKGELAAKVKIHKSRIWFALRK